MSGDLLSPLPVVGRARALSAAAIAVLVFAGCGANAVEPSQSVAPSAVPTGTPTAPPAASAPAPPTASAPLSPSVPPTLPTPTIRPTPSPSPTSSPTSSPTPSLGPATPAPTAYPRGSVIVTFGVGNEQYRVLLIQRADIRTARALLRGEQAPRIPNGLVVRGDPGVNVGWGWHIDPADFEFADATTEVCDGLPSFVERGIITSDRFCPWTARVLAIESID